MPRIFLLWLLCVWGIPAGVSAQDASGTGSLWTIPLATIGTKLPPDTQVLIERSAIEAFLTELDGTPPDWANVYGHGHHDADHDERLFNLNRERDAAREGKAALTRRVAFVWPGELSRFDPESRGYAVSLGPEYNRTSWGIVRFKPEALPGNLRVSPHKKLAARIRSRLAKGEIVDVTVVLVGTLVPTESIVYDFSHDEEGRGMVMPVVRIEQVAYLLK
ncbi:MAG: hypothetical protein HP492_17965 [Nitrospira sp.]|nr:hypothetical protein [Nitrospira sp.]